LLAERTQLREIGGAGLGPHFHHRAAGEVDAEIHADGEEQYYRCDRRIAENG